MPPDGSFTTLTHDVETPASSPAIFVDHTSKHVLSLEPAGDVFFGLLPGTNGTAAITRRKCGAPDDYTWHSSDCRRARGVFSVPSGRSDELQTNPWSGRP
jgi:hypothetical protein